MTNKVTSTYSSTVTLTVVTAPVITTQPASKTVTAGKAVTFKVAASGKDLSYQWYYRTSSTGSWTKVSKNGTSASYKLTTAARHNGYQYRCVISNIAGKVTSKTVTLTVK